MWLTRILKPLPSAFTCPRCGTPTRSARLASLYFCDRCNDFTGLCAAGRALHYPAIFNPPGWRVGCTTVGAVAWDVTLPSGRKIRVLLCAEHDRQANDVPWINGRRAGAPLPHGTPRSAVRPPQ